MELNLFNHFSNLFKELHTKIDKLVPVNKIVYEPMMSEKTNEIAEALAKAQGQIQIAKHNQINPYFQSPYEDLKSVIEASRKPLTDNNLAVSQQIVDYEDGSWLITVLLHLSGQWIKAKRRIAPPKNDIQSIHSYTTFLKRMAYASIVGVGAENEDDDGERAMATSRETFAKGTALNNKYNPKENTAEVITKEQREEVEYELAEYPDIAETVLDSLKIQSIADIPKSKFMNTVTRIRKIKNLRNHGIEL